MSMHEINCARLDETLATIASGSGIEIVGATLDGDSLADFTWPARVALVIGNEANGIRPEVAQRLHHRVRIPSYGRAESLNAAVAAAILIADWRRSCRR